MKKGRIIALGIIAAVIVFAAAGFFTYKSMQNSKYPQIVYIDNTSYYGTGEECEMVPRKAPDGIIETFVPAQIMPDAYNSANFGEKYGSLEYMYLEDGQLIVHIGEKWYYFK